MNQKEEDAFVEEPPEERKCKKCGAPIYPDDEYCKNCGAKVKY